MGQNLRNQSKRLKYGIMAMTAGLLTLLVSEMLFYFYIYRNHPIGGVVKTGVYGVILLFALVCYSKKLLYVDRPLRIFGWFTALAFASTCFGVTPDIALLRQLIHMSLFFAVLVAFYIGTEMYEGSLTKTAVKVMYAVTVLVFIYALLTKGLAIEDSANTVYFLLLFLPCTVFFERKYIRFCLYIIQIAFVLISNKRTAFIMLVAYFLMSEYQHNKQISFSMKALKAVGYTFIIIFIYIIYPYTVELLNITIFDELSKEAIEADGGSNRTYIFDQLWNAQKKGDFKHWLMGDGYNSVILSRICTDGVGGNWVSAHNDFLEVLYDYGLVGLALYASFFVVMIKRAVEMSRRYYRFAPAFWASIVIILIGSFTTHFIIYLNYYAVIMAFWGFCLADFKRFKRNKQE